MTKKSSGSNEPQKTKSSDIGKLKEDKDFQEFIKNMKLTNQLAEAPEDLPIRQQRELINKFWAWDKAGKPGLQMPDFDSTRPQIVKVYRIKELGKQYLAYVNEKSEKVGIETKKIYGTKQLQDPDDVSKTKTVEDKDNLLKTDVKYTIPYAESKAKEFIEMALETYPNPTFYFIRKPRKVSVTETDNFTGDFDDLMKKANKGEII